MTDFIFYTTEGFTQAPNGNDIENCQMLGIAKGKDKVEAHPYKLIRTPRLVSKQNIPSGYLLRMGNGAEEFLLLDYDPKKPAEIESYDIKKVMRKGKGRYLPFVASISDIKTK